MTISISTMGKFWPQLGGGTTTTTTTVIEGGGTYGGGIWEKKKPVVIIDSVREKNIKISVVVTEVEDD